MEIKKEILIELSKKQIVNIIGLLTAQLVDETLINNHSGACPQACPMIFIIDTNDNEETKEIIDMGDWIINIAKPEADNFIKGLIDILVGKEESVSLYISNSYYSLRLQVLHQELLW